MVIYKHILAVKNWTAIETMDMFIKDEDQKLVISTGGPM